MVPAQFPLKGPLIIDVLDEFGHAQFGIVEDFEPDAVAPGQPQGSQVQPGFIDFVIGNPDPGTIHGQLVGNLVFLQMGHNLGGIFGGQIAV